MLILLISLIIILSVAIVEFSISPTIFEYDRISGKCIRKYKHFWQSSYKERVLCYNQAIKDVRIEKKRYNMKGHTYYVIIELKNGQDIYVFPDGSSSKRFCDKLVLKINNFLKSNSNQLLLKDNFILHLLIGLISLILCSLEKFGLI